MCALALCALALLERALYGFEERDGCLGGVEEKRSVIAILRITCQHAKAFEKHHRRRDRAGHASRAAVIGGNALIMRHPDYDGQSYA